MKVLGVVPARYQSSRLPGKPIVDICGKANDLVGLPAGQKK